MCKIGNGHYIPQDATLHYADWALVLFGIHGPDVPPFIRTGKTGRKKKPNLAFGTPVSDPSFDIFRRLPQTLLQPANIFS